MRELILTSLYLVYFLTCTAQRSRDTENNMYESKIVLITSEALCGKLIDINPNIKYIVQMSLLHSSCPNSERKGFNCSLVFHQKDRLALVGSQLCVDLQGIAKTIPDTQIALSVLNQLHQDLRTVVAASRLFPEDAPYYVCSSESQSTLSVYLSVLKSVEICPDIMYKMVNSNISFGSVIMKPILPTYIFTKDNCSIYLTVRENEYIVKSALEGYSSLCSFQIFNNISHQYTNTCIELIYVSLDYKCNISVELFMSSQLLSSFDVPDGSQSAWQKRRLCKSYSGATNLVLMVRKYSRSVCIGNFAVKTSSFTDSDSTDTTDDSQVDDMRQMYMAVFISLISLCLLILCITCIFCLRMRSKRLQRTQRGALSNAPVPNRGFNASGGDLSNQDVSCSPSNSSEMYGLPLYDDIFGKDICVTGHQASTTDQKPPDYEALFSSNV
jgi:hypothetical protein